MHPHIISVKRNYNLQIQVEIISYTFILHSIQ